MERPINGARLCPSCANTIEETAVKCPYCRAEFTTDSAPQWLNRNTPLSERATDLKRTKKSPITRFVWPATTLILVLVAFYAGAYMQHRQGALTAEAYSKQLQTKDQLMQSQETQMIRLRQELHDNENQLADLKTKLEASQKAVATTQQRLAAANHEVERLNTTRSSAATRVGSRAPAPSQTYPAPLPTARPAAAGVYETVRETSVYDNPSPQGRVISQIRGGTRINVVSSGGNWLEVRSKHGNPPGYVRSGDARLVSRAN